MNDECMRTEYKCFPGGKILHPSSYDKCKSEYLQLFMRIESRDVEAVDFSAAFTASASIL